MDTIINIVICRDIAGQMHADGLDPLRPTCRTTHTVVRNILCPAKGLHMGIIDDTACYTLCLQINLDRFETFTLSSSTRDCSTWHCIHPAIRLCMYLIITVAAGVTDGFWISLISIASRRFPCPTVPAVSPPFVHELQPYVCICTRYNTS